MHVILTCKQFPHNLFFAYDGPCKNGHLFGLHHGTPDDLPLEVQVEVSATSELGAEYIGQTWHMPLSDFDRISEVKLK
jgi:hypothetical protein